MEFAFLFSSIFLLLAIVDGFHGERYRPWNRGQRRGQNKQKNPHFTCLKGTHKIPSHFVCNGQFDCSDLSDEYLCSRQKREFKNSNFSNDILSKLERDDQVKGLCPGVVKRSNVIKQKLLILRKLLLADSAIEFSKRACIPKVFNPTDGVLDSCVHCKPGEIFCLANRTRLLQVSNDTTGVCVQKSKVCDGKPDCAGEEDEIYCSPALMSVSGSGYPKQNASLTKHKTRFNAFRQRLLNVFSTSIHNHMNINRTDNNMTDREIRTNFPISNNRNNITITCSQLSKGLQGLFKDENEGVFNRTRFFPPIVPPLHGFPPPMDGLVFPRPFLLAQRSHNHIGLPIRGFGLQFPQAISQGGFPPSFMRDKMIEIFINMTNNLTTVPRQDGLNPFSSPFDLVNTENQLSSGHLTVSTLLNELFTVFSKISLPNEETTQDFISTGQYCDGVVDCPSKADERTCPGRFYCESGNTFYVDKTAVMDGIADCDDESDEWPDDYAKSTMASKDSMIKDWPLLLLMWTTGIVSVLGNSVVIITSVKSFIPVSKNGRATIHFMSTTRSRRKNVCSKRTNTGKSSIKISERQRIIKLWNGGLVLNLALADFLMGFYLLSLASISVSKQKGYWAFDKSWRTSVNCQLLGTIVMVSSQTSVYTLVGLTTLRLYTVIKPFSVAYLQKKNLLIFCIIAWLTSIVLAVLPSAPYVKYYFASEAWVSFPHFRPPILDLAHADKLVRTLADLTDVPLAGGLEESQLSWLDILDYVNENFPAYSNWKFFGFYSAHSVCIPKLYVTTDDVGWWYTAAFLCISLVAVLYMGIAYSIIYFHSTSILRSSSSKRDVVDGERGSRAISDSDSCNTTLGEASGQANCTESQYLRLKSLFDCRMGRKKVHDNIKETNTKEDSISSGRLSIMTKSTDNTSEMQCRIALLIVTDCLCWIPICVMGFCSLAGHHIPGRAYSISAIGILPVNSALNPLLYSRTIQDFRKKYCGQLKKYISLHVCRTENSV